jgi:hypothetical protein
MVKEGAVELGTITGAGSAVGVGGLVDGGVVVGIGVAVKASAEVVGDGTAVVESLMPHAETESSTTTSTWAKMK